MLAQAEQLLRQYYGYSSFLPGQATIIESILNRRDTFAIMPTGAGKSVCYQIPALLQPGVTIVISPLISLMKDQVDALNSLGVPCSFINSSLSYREVRERLNNAERGAYKLLYVAPERLESEAFLEFVRAMPVSFVAIDEAHCVSQWGHDFRPSYRHIAPFIRELPERPVVAAFTATATVEVREDVLRLLDLMDPTVHVTGFDRANLSFSVRRGTDKKGFLLRFIERHQDDSGIVYAGTRKEVERLCEFLQARGFAAGKYHAGLSDAERIRNQEQFLFDNIRVMVATNAFGMGIDKSNVRYVLHYNMPKNMESYYQEAGRAGRDGDPGECVMLFSPQDIFINKYLIEQTTLSPERKANELKKLQTMIEYAHTTQCLRRFILAYFGDEHPVDSCGNCGNCNGGTMEDDHHKDGDDIRPILECVMSLRERYGVSVLVDILKGSRRQKYLAAGWESLPVYGRLGDWSREQIRERINALVAEGYLRLTDGPYPVVKLQDKALALFDNALGDTLRSKENKAVRPEPSGLLAKLKRLRREIAEAEGVPPYIIFADSTLHAMAIQLPEDLVAMRLVKGVGQRKLDLYGERFLQVIREFRNTTDSSALILQQQQTPQAKDASRISHDHKPEKSKQKPEKSAPSHLVTYRMYQAGHALESIAKQRGLTLQTIMTHIIRCSTEGLAVNWDEIIPVDQEVLILEQIAKLGSVRLKPIKDSLPPYIGYEMILAVIAKCRKRKQG